MNPMAIMSVVQLIQMAMQVVVMVEQASPPGTSGNDKLALVLQAFTSTMTADQVPSFLQTKWPQIQAFVSSLVTIYNMIGVFKKSAAPVSNPVLAGVLHMASPPAAAEPIPAAMNMLGGATLASTFPGIILNPNAVAPQSSVVGAQGGQPVQVGPQ